MKKCSLPQSSTLPNPFTLATFSHTLTSGHNHDSRRKHINQLLLKAGLLVQMCKYADIERFDQEEEEAAAGSK